MTNVFQPPPTYALPILVDETTGKAIFNPIWLNWFLEFAAGASSGGAGSVSSVSVSGGSTGITTSGSPITNSGTITLDGVLNTGHGGTGNTSGAAASVPLSGVTGLGTGVATALALNVGNAGALVTFNGAGGTPSSLTGTNITGTASGLTAGKVTTNANLTGPITSVGNVTTVAGGVVAFGPAAVASITVTNGIVTAIS